MDHLSSTKPLLCRDFLGRERELQALHEALQLAAGGRPQLVLVSGEAGIGKTRLCRTFAEISQAQQARVLLGQAIPQDAALPFGPLLDAFRRYFTTNSTIFSSDHPLHPAFAFLLRLLPELAAQFPAATPPPFDVAGTPAQQQAIFHSMLGGLQVLAGRGQGPVLLILEDLHWADETSLELLAFLANRLEVNTPATGSTGASRSTPLLLLGTYRTEALASSPAFERFVTALRAQRQVDEVPLAPLSEDLHRRCVSSILGQPVPEEFATFLFGWDEGNPFFCEEVLGAMVTAGQLQLQQHRWLISPGMRPKLPRSLTASIIERMQRLPAADQEVLAYAATIGRVFDPTLLAALSGRDEHELVAVLRRAMQAQLLSEADETPPLAQVDGHTERYQFRHALTREALYEHMLPLERRLRHRAIAELLERLASDQLSLPASTLRQEDLPRLLAEHYWLAGMPQKARPYALQEAERARQVFAFREERHYLEMAQASLPPESAEQLALLERLGILSLVIFDLPAAFHWLSQARLGYQRIGEQRQALRVLANMLVPNWLLASPAFPGILAELEAAAEAIFTQSDAANRDVGLLVIISFLASHATLDCQHQHAALWVERSLALYEQLDDPRKEAAIQLSLITEGWIKAHQHASMAEEGIAETLKAINAAREYSVPDVVLIGYVSLAWILMHWGRNDEAGQVAEAMIDLESRTGGRLHSFMIGFQRFFSGERWEEATLHLHRDIKLTEQANVPTYTALNRVPLAHLLIARTELEEARAQLEAAQPTLEFLNEFMYFGSMWWGWARLYAAESNHTQAQEWYERCLSRWQTTDDRLLILPILLDGIEYYTDSGNLLRAGQWLAELETLVRATDNPVGMAGLLEAQGVLEAAQGEMEPAIQSLRQAVEAWSKLKRPYRQALASERLTKLLLAWAERKTAGQAVAQRMRAEADMLLQETATIYERLRIPSGLQAVQALRASAHLDAQDRRRTTLEARHPLPGLTRRETQVLMQLAAGRSNKEIAAALMMSERTVEVHVAHILSKLGCDTRTQAATYAVTRRWVKNQVPF